jgi:hypothetical protein
MNKPHRRNLRPRTQAPLPAERLAEQPFIYCSGRLIAPWPRHALWPDEAAKLAAVVDQIDTYGAALRVPCWLWPDARPPTPVNAADPNFVRRWSDGRASYVRG